LQTVIFSTPGSPGLPRIMSTVKARGWSAGLFLQDLAPPAPGDGRRVRDLILLPRGTPSGRRPAIPRKRELSTFSEALTNDLEYYRGAAQRVGHAAEI